MDELCLKWNEHHPSVMTVFEELLEKGSLVDCTIAAGGQYMKAHKVVLAACSPYFELLFSQENEKNPIVVLKDIKFQEVKYLIDFMYRGNVKLQREELDSFIIAAESLQIKGLSEHRKSKMAEIAAKKAVRGSLSSPVPCKRRRNSRSEGIEDTRSVLSLGNDNSNDSNLRVITSVETAKTLSASITSTANCSAIATPHFLSAQPDQLPETDFSPQEEVLSDAQSVVKLEPDDTQPLPEIFLPEPKNEEYVDDMAQLESDIEIAGSQSDSSRQNTNNITGFSYGVGDAFAENQADRSATTALAAISVTARLPTPPPQQQQQPPPPQPTPPLPMPLWSTLLRSTPQLSTPLSVITAAVNGVEIDAAAKTLLSKLLPTLLPTFLPALPSPVLTPPAAVRSSTPTIVLPRSSTPTIVLPPPITLRNASVARTGPFGPSAFGRPAEIDPAPVAPPAPTAEALALQRPPQEKDTSKATSKPTPPPPQPPPPPPSPSPPPSLPPEPPQPDPKESARRLMSIAQRDAQGVLRCPVCGMPMPSSCLLRKHLRVHTGERPYRCDFCEKAFSQHGNLTIHRRQHTGERPFKCMVCDRAFYTSSHLTVHSRVHTGERPYECSQCDRVFSSNSDLHKHRRRCHRAPPPLPRDHKVLKKTLELKKSLDLNPLELRKSLDLNPLELRKSLDIKALDRMPLDLKALDID